MRIVFQDLRYATRVLLKNPGFTLIAALTLALGIGANASIFSVVNGVLLSPLPYPHPEQLVSITGSYPRGAFVAMRTEVRALDVATYAEGHEFNLTGFGEPVRLSGTYVSAELFSILGALPELGRVFHTGEDASGQDSFVILSHSLWQQQFAADPSIIGRAIDLDGVSRQVIGVMPSSFRFPSRKTQFWIPLHNDPRAVHDYWAGDFMTVIGRLHPGATITQAQAEIRIFQSRVFALFPWPMPPQWNADISVIPLDNGMVAQVRPRLILLLGAVAVVLLIACANVANLLLSRGASREKEISIRIALGAARPRLVSQLLTESVLLASFGGFLGFLFAAAALPLLKAVLPADTPRLADVQLDWHVLIFTFAVSLLTGILFGLPPALYSSRSTAEAVRSGDRGSVTTVARGLRSSLVVAEIAFASLLVISAGLLIRSLWSISHVNLGFRSEHILTARITPGSSFCADPDRCLSFYRNLLQQLQSTPVVTAAALVNTLPLDGRVAKRNFEIENYALPAGESSPLFWMNVVTPAYFRVMGTPVLEGRDFGDADISGAAVAIVTAETARRFWPNSSAVGKHVRLLDEKGWRTVVGVIADVRAYDLQHNAPAWVRGTAFIPYNSSATLENHKLPADMTLALRTGADDPQIAATVRHVVATVNPLVPVSELKVMTAVLADAIATPASTASLFAVFAAVALALGMIGVYGVLSFLVSRRTREIGIRIALGAQRSHLLWMILGEGARLALLGIFLGVAAALFVTRLLSSELYGVTASDFPTYAVVLVAMIATTFLACYIPTRRAMSIDPLAALRHE